MPSQLSPQPAVHRPSELSHTEGGSKDGSCLAEPSAECRIEGWFLRILLFELVCYASLENQNSVFINVLNQYLLINIKLIHPPGDSDVARPFYTY